MLSVNRGRLELRFRYDSKTLMPFWLRHAMRAFHEAAQSPEFAFTFPPRVGSILVIDNHRLLHGRTAWHPGADHVERKFRRVWMRAPAEGLVGLEVAKANRVSARFASYLPVKASWTQLETGIVLNHDARARLERLRAGL